MENLIIIIILLCVTGSIIRYLHRARKEGQVYIGCPCARQCNSCTEGNCHDISYGEFAEDLPSGDNGMVNEKRSDLE